jgi:hypothetical protein
MTTDFGDSLLKSVRTIKAAFFLVAAASLWQVSSLTPISVVALVSLESLRHLVSITTWSNIDTKHVKTDIMIMASKLSKVAFLYAASSACSSLAVLHI